MEIKQAFEILRRAGGGRAARIITNNHTSLPAWRVWWAAKRLERGAPVAKIVRQKWFYGMPFYTDKWTLDPRPDTETLVSAVLAETVTSDKRQVTRILDLGTGTGCVIASIVKNIPNATGIGIDKSIMAVRVAKKNMRDLKLTDRINIIRGDFTTGNLKLGTEKFDVIVANPPYIAYSDRRLNAAARHDPSLALYAKNNGLAAYESIAKNAPLWLKPCGNMYLEIGIDQGVDVRNIMQAAGWEFIQSFNDLSGIERVLQFKK